MIEDKQQFDSFVAWLPELEHDEVFFVSLSARNKYLTDEEREFYGLGRTEMFSRYTAHDKEGLDYVMQKLRASLSYRKTHGGKQIPEKALVTYMNVNPCSMVDAYINFTHEMDTIMKEMHQAVKNGREVPSYEPWWKLQRRLMNCVQKTKARRLIIDVDIDSKDPEILDEMKAFLSSKGIEFRTVETHGGFHVLIDKSTLNKTNIYSKIVELDARCEKEVCINKNGMVPVPGTLQAGRLVLFN